LTAEKPLGNAPFRTPIPCTTMKKSAKRSSMMSCISSDALDGIVDPGPVFAAVPRGEISMTKVKICGMLTTKDVEACKGADYCGFVVESRSRRNLKLQEAKDLMSVCPTRKVLVTTSLDPIAVLKAANVLEPDAIQVQSLMSPVDLRFLLIKTKGMVWASVQIGTGMEEKRISSIRSVSNAILLETKGYKMGDAWMKSDWKTCASIRDRLDPYPIILLGGLTPRNVEEAVAEVRPFAVDVSAGLETDGRKNETLVNHFILKVKSVIEDENLVSRAEMLSEKQVNYPVSGASGPTGSQGSQA